MNLNITFLLVFLCLPREGGSGSPLIQSAFMYLHSEYGGENFFEIYFSDTINSMKKKARLGNWGISVFGCRAVVSDRVVTEFSLSKDVKTK